MPILHSASVNGPDPSSADQLRPYDFRQPKLVSKEIIRVMRDIHEMYARHMKRIFANVLNHSLDVNLVDIEQVIFSNYLNEIEPPSALFLFNIEELGDWAVLQLDPSFCVYCVERQSGGQKMNPEGKRILTRLEERIMGHIIDKSLKDLCHVWSAYISLNIENYIYESRPANIRTISANAPGIVLRFQFRFDEYVIPCSVCYPYGMLKDQLLGSTLLSGNGATTQTLTASQQRYYEADIKQVKTEMKVLLGKASLPLHRLIHLEEGDLIMLDQQIEDTLDITVDDKLIMHGYPGSLNGRRAVKIFDVAQNRNNLTE